jgi:hypothetical protein
MPIEVEDEFFEGVIGRSKLEVDCIHNRKVFTIVANNALTEFFLGIFLAGCQRQ